MYDLNLTVPNISSEKYSTDARFVLIKNYLYELNETLSNVLGGIDTSNISAVLRAGIENGESALKLSKTIKADVLNKFSRLKEEILRTADEIEQDYSTAIEQSETELLQTATGLFTAKSEFGQYKNETDTALSQTSEAISLNAESTETVSAALQSYISENDDALGALTDNVEEYKISNNAELELTSSAIKTYVGLVYSSKNELLELAENISSEITQTASDVTETFNSSVVRVADELSTLTGSFSDYITSLEVYIRRGELESGVYGIEIGRSDSNVKARFTNDKLSFIQGNAEIAYISDSTLYITRAEMLDYLKLGNTADGYFTFDVTQNGLELRWNNGN